MDREFEAASEEQRRADELAELLMADHRQYTSRQVASAVGVPLYRARRFWRALGFASVDDDLVEFTESDVEALTTLVRLVNDGIMDEPDALALTRSLGLAAARLAESQAEAVVQRLDQAGLSGAARIEYVFRLARRLRKLEQLLIYAWRRQLAASAHRLEHDARESMAGVMAVGFADLVGFTELGRALAEDELIAVVDTFEGRSAEVIADSGARLVKLIGDEVLFVSRSRSAAAETALRLLAVLGAVRGMPQVRVGLAVGKVVSRQGDVFGHAVNLASRLTRLAAPGTVLVDPDLARALAKESSYSVTPGPTHHVRGIGPITPSVLSWSSASASALPSRRRP
jgi:adenylate cyclase